MNFLVWIFSGIIAGGLAGVLVKGRGFGLPSDLVIGLLGGWSGVSKQHILKYEEHLKSGNYLVIASGSQEEIEEAKAILSGTSQTELTAHS